MIQQAIPKKKCRQGLHPAGATPATGSAVPARSMHQHELLECLSLSLLLRNGFLHFNGLLF